MLHHISSTMHSHRDVQRIDIIQGRKHNPLWTDNPTLIICTLTLPCEENRWCNSLNYWMKNDLHVNLKLHNILIYYPYVLSVDLNDNFLHLISFHPHDATPLPVPGCRVWAGAGGNPELLVLLQWERWDYIREADRPLRSLPFMYYSWGSASKLHSYSWHFHALPGKQALQQHWPPCLSLPTFPSFFSCFNPHS